MNVSDDKPYDGEFVCKATFRCRNAGEPDDLWLMAEPVAEAGQVKFRSERCPQCGSKHWTEKTYEKYA